jgi:hypothetical protein
MYPNLPLSTPAWVVVLRAVAADHVLRRHVAVDDLERLALPIALAVREVQALADLARDPRRHHRRHVPPHAAEAVHDLEEILPPDVLHRDVVGVADLPELVDRDDVRVGQMPGDLRLVDEHRDEVFVLRHRGEDPLDRDDLLEALDAERLGGVDLRHPADSEAIEEEVLPERDDAIARPPSAGRRRSGRTRGRTTRQL